MVIDTSILDVLAAALPDDAPAELREGLTELGELMEQSLRSVERVYSPRLRDNLAKQSVGLRTLTMLVAYTCKLDGSALEDIANAMLAARNLGVSCGIESMTAAYDDDDAEGIPPLVIIPTPVEAQAAGISFETWAESAEEQHNVWAKRYLDAYPELGRIAVDYLTREPVRAIISATLLAAEDKLTPEDILPLVSAGVYVGFEEGVHRGRRARHDEPETEPDAGGR